jgi:hypothetical protein
MSIVKAFKDITEPKEYILQRAETILNRIENIAIGGTNKDSTKLKANLALLNKILPDSKGAEDNDNLSPFERLMNSL